MKKLRQAPIAPPLAPPEIQGEKLEIPRSWQTADEDPLLDPRTREGRLLSIIAPMYNEEAVLAQFLDHVIRLAENLGVAFELVCVDDGSRDSTLLQLVERSRRDPRVKVIALARNFGKEGALTAGIEAASGDMVVPIDTDLQDPPELIADFIDLWERGYDVVYGVRKQRAGDSFLKRRTAELFYRLFNKISDLPIPANTGDFRLMDRQVVEAVKSLPERNRFMKGLFAWVGFRQIGVSYARRPRAAGKTSWRYLKLFNFAVDGITSFSSLPLRIWTAVGMSCAGLALVAAAGLAFRTLIFGRDLPGYASMMVVMLFSLALQMIAFGILGEYIGRLYQESKERPVYLVRRRYGFPDPPRNAGASNSPRATRDRAYH